MWSWFQPPSFARFRTRSVDVNQNRNSLKRQARKTSWFWGRAEEEGDRNDLAPPAPPGISYRGQVVSGLAKLSPMLGRKLASALGTESPERLHMEELAEDIAAEAVRKGMEDYAILAATDIPTSPKGAKANEKVQEVAATETSGEEAKKAAQKEEKPLYRYYHVFKEKELPELVSQVPTLKVINSYYDHANWCVIAEKRHPDLII